MIKPHAIQLEASSFCQLRCPSCPTATRAIDAAVGRGFLKLADFTKLLDDNPWVRFVELSNYGEMFLNPFLPAILAEGHRRGVALAANNGVNLNNARPEALEAIVRYGLRGMTCSIDGASEETYRQYRVRGKFERVIEHIREINRWKAELNAPYPVMRWQFVMFGHNEHEIGAARRMAAELGMEFYTKLTWDDEFSPVRDPELVRRESGLDAATRAEFEQRAGHDIMQGICHQLWDSPQINWDGKLLGCCRNFWGDFGGNAFKDGLRACLENEKISYARDMLLGRQPSREDIPCDTCEIYLKMRSKNRWLKRPTCP